MRISGLTPNSFTCAGVLISTAGLQSLVLGQSIHGPDVKTGLESDIIVGTTMLDKYAKCGSMIDSYKVFQLLLTFSLQFSRILFSSNFCKTCWFACALWVKSLSYLEHSPSSTNSKSCSIKALICHQCCLFAIPAMTKKPSIFSLLPIILKENKTKPGTNIIISWPKPSLGPVQTWETDSAVSSI